MVIWLALLEIAIASNFSYIPESRDLPTGRLYQSMSYQPMVDSLVVTGGQEDNSILFDDIWSYDFNVNYWSMQMSPDDTLPGEY